MNISARLLTIFTLFLLLQGCSSEDSDALLWPLKKDCDLHQSSCTHEFKTADGLTQSVTLSIMPKPIPVARSLSIIADVENLAIETAEFDISGINMYMGFNRVNLATTDGNRWGGSSMLAFCTDEQMEWQLTLMLNLKDGSKVQVPFYLAMNNKQ